MIEYERTYQFCKILVNTIYVSNDFFIHFGHSELRQLCKGKSMTKMEINCFFPVMQPSLKKKCGFFCGNHL